MDKTALDTASETLDTLNALVMRAVWEVENRTKQLEEIVPRREALEARCREKYKHEIADLPAVLAQKTAQFVADVGVLEADVASAREASNV